MLAAERSQRDLICLLALPALWAGRDRATILRLMVEAVERAVPVDFCYMNVGVDVGAAPVATLRVEGRTLVEHTGAWQGVVARCLAMPHVRSKPTQLATPLGELNTIRLDIGYGGAGGSIWYGSALAGFPSVVQLSFLRAAASLAATGLCKVRASAATAKRRAAPRTSFWRCWDTSFATRWHLSSRRSRSSS